METQEKLSKGKAETFICPGCGDKVAENEDLIICDDCFQEAMAIRAIRSRLAAGGLTPAGINVASCHSGRNGVYLQPVGTHEDAPFEPPRR